MTAKYTPEINVNKDLRIIVARLCEMAAGGTENIGNRSICEEMAVMWVDCIISFNYDFVPLIIKRLYPHYSYAQRLYPIELSPQAFANNCDKWGDNELGNRRRRLCKWLAENLTEEDLSDD